MHVVDEHRNDGGGGGGGSGDGGGGGGGHASHHHQNHSSLSGLTGLSLSQSLPVGHHGFGGGGGGHHGHSSYHDRHGSHHTRGQSRRRSSLNFIGKKMGIDTNLSFHRRLSLHSRDHHHHHHHHHHPASVSFRSEDGLEDVEENYGQQQRRHGDERTLGPHDRRLSFSDKAGRGGGGGHNGAGLPRLDESAWESRIVGEEEEDATSSKGLGADSQSGHSKLDGDDASSIPDDIRERFLRQDRKVKRLKAVVVAVLIIAAVVVTVLVYKSTTSAEHSDFLQNFDNLATKITTAFNHNINTRVWTAYTLSAAYTARCRNDFSGLGGGGGVAGVYAGEADGDGDGRSPYSFLHGGWWPNVTLPDFRYQAHGSHVLAHARQVAFSPLVRTEEDRARWEAYALQAATALLEVDGNATLGGGEEKGSDDGGYDAAAHSQQGQVDEDAAPGDTSSGADAGEGAAGGGTSAGADAGEGGGRNLRGVPTVGDGMEAGVGSGPGDGDDEDKWSPIHHTIYRLNGTDVVPEDDPSGGPFAPLWQVSPYEGNEMGIMYNLRSEPYQRRAIDGMIRHRVPTLTEMMHHNLEYHLDRRYNNVPTSILFYPVYDTFYKGGGHGNKGEDEDDVDERNLVGMMSITFSWHSAFSNLLPDKFNGITCVLETNTGQQYTYTINGKTAILVGRGDLHDRAYDSHVLTMDYNMDFDAHGGQHHRRGRTTPRTRNGMRDADAAGGGDDELVSYTLRVYPSAEFEAAYKSNQPVVYAVSVALIFFVTAATFMLYDCYVQRRQMNVMRAAVRSTKLVNSLFPANVRDRLFSQHDVPDCDDDDENGKTKKGITKIIPRKVTEIITTSGNPTEHLKKFLVPPSQEGDDLTTLSGSQPPIADMFPETTILFADIAGFTAWSSEREPAQVFQLLESLFREFDSEAKIQGVFKVETIGDCYVAVAGLPDPRPDHALAMARFAQRCLWKFCELTKELELTLGPGTAELGMRIGMHSGPVTAGVLRGEKSRFQLFGDTMNTASRMESTGIKNMIQVSQETADLLKAAGKVNCLVPREGGVQAKGKGTLQTYWVRPKAMRKNSAAYSFAGNDNELSQPSIDDVDDMLMQAEEDNYRAELGLPPEIQQESPIVRIQPTAMLPQRSTSAPAVAGSANPLQASFKDSSSWKETGLQEYGNQTGEGLQRLVKWNTAVLESILAKGIVHRKRKLNRRSRKSSKVGMSPGPPPTPTASTTVEDSMKDDGEKIVFSEEIAEAVDFPNFDSDAVYEQFNCKSTIIPSQVRKELHDFVTRIASMYRSVHFHNFEHASHVTMSANKLINKVCSRNCGGNSNSSTDGEEKKSDRDLTKQRKGQVDLFFSTYGISADFLAQFAVVFAALVHDVGHTGVPNVQLIKEKPDLALRYKNKSVAENNSIAVAWSILKEPGKYDNLLKCIFPNEGDEARFRQLLINVVIATDIADRERRAGERKRWEKAFADSKETPWEDEWQSLSDDQLSKVDISLKATVVLEQIVLASDVAHTMQHWLTYVKWNERLYKELWSAYKSGRAEKDPTVNWYEGEVGFFDGYIIPLASKLKECGVFGTAGDEYLGNALRNRQEWIDKGKKITEMFEETIKNAPSAENGH